MPSCGHRACIKHAMTRSFSPPWSDRATSPVLGPCQSWAAVRDPLVSSNSGSAPGVYKNLIWSTTAAVVRRLRHWRHSDNTFQSRTGRHACVFLIRTWTRHLSRTIQIPAKETVTCELVRELLRTDKSFGLLKRWWRMVLLTCQALTSG